MMYVEQFRRLCTDIKQMSELDKVTFCIRGLKLKTREELKCRQCKPVTAAMKVALEYEKAHAESLGIRVQGKQNRWSLFKEEHRRSLPQQLELQESVDMEVDNMNVRERSKRKDRSKIRCYNCQKLLLRFRTTKQLEAQYKTIRAADQRLMIKPGVMNGNDVNVMINSGETTSLYRVGMGSCVAREKTVRIAGYDNVVSNPTQTHEVTETLTMDSMRFVNVTMIEWDLKDKEFDIILGQPWFRQYNPVINWRDQVITSVDEEVKTNALITKDCEGWILKLFHVEV
ncbi:hypothetical protein DYB32_009949 [Aphanomyces invadans]|uniref:Uncharacterized protein n=1 Tax=Aphanomyces invadans TaxID=157072 RepID=A0A3R6YRV5_9STRA|nr:hypothetical protein DYB32_009949 [Aphanomyces invadans]